MTQFTKLRQLINDYNNQPYVIKNLTGVDGKLIEIEFSFESRRDFLSKYLSYYQESTDLSEVIDDACKAIFEVQKDGKVYKIRHSHQVTYQDSSGKDRGIIVPKLNDKAKKVQARKQDILKAKHFDDLIKIINEDKIIGFGELAIYDAAVRISAYLTIKPDKVYLHAGTRDGMKALEEHNLVPQGASSAPTVSVDDLPEPLKELHPSETENFLCIYKAKLRKY